MSKDWTGGAQSPMKVLGASNHSDTERQQEDYYATNPKTVEKLLEVESFNHYIWEPACGEGHISKVLEAHWHKVFSTDLIDRGYGRGNTDFLKYKPEKGRNSMDIITNPPYKYAQEFVEHALDISMESVKIAMLLKIQFLEGKKRRPLFDKHPPQTIYVFTERQECAKNGIFTGGSAVCYAWFVWKKGYCGPTRLKWI